MEGSVSEELTMRERVALENGFKLYVNYSEQQAAGIFKVDYSTLKRWRKNGLIKWLRYGIDGVRYAGTEIADILIHGTRPWGDTPNENTASAPPGSPSGEVSGAEPGSMQPPGKRAALASALRTLNKPRSG